MRLAIVLNRSARLLQTRGDETVADIEKRANNVGTVDSTRLVDPAALATTLAAAAASKPDVLLVGGGDGTIAAAAAVAIQTGLVLGILPLGTLNHFARDVGIPADPGEAVDGLANSRVRHVDVGEVNGRIFLNNSVIGLYPAMVALRERQQRLIGKWPAMALAAAVTFARFTRLPITVDWGQGPRRVRVPILGVSNNLYDEVDGLFVHRSQIDAGNLGVYLVHSRSGLQLFQSALNAMRGNWRGIRDLDVLKAKDIVVDGRQRTLLVATDGEVHKLEVPLRYQLRPKALRILAPATAVGG